ncbi:HNH endonuclease [Nocardia brasiliensis]|uniref:HNH endonuclease n=1 Tax=Nocardia brasiliensis TaxID=37326 RepID=UPI0024566C94|nr:HNH endonuclease [Nocardia brasiliensis]
MRKTGPSKKVVDLIRDRSAGICEICGWAEGQQIHHRRPRKMGGTRDPQINSPANLLHLCNLCHAVVEGNRLDAETRGYLLKMGADFDQPVWYRGQHKVLDGEGGVSLCESAP